MSLWRLTRDEMTGAWRSLRYDLARRANERGWHVGPLSPPTTTGGPTGVHRSPRLIAAAAFAILAVGGSAGSYLAVVTGVGSLLDEPTGPEPYPLVAEAAPQAAMPTPTTVVNHRDGRAAVAPGRVVVVTVTVSPPATTTPTVGTPTQPVRAVRTVTTTPVRLPGTPTRPGSPTRTASPQASCDCPNPPVPTPTSPPTPSASPSDDPSPSAEPSDPVDTSPTAVPSTSDDADAEADGGASGEPDDDRDDERNIRRGIG